jgi:hypothetical protein
MTIVDLPDPMTVPGALQIHKTRELVDGSTIEFEFAPTGWTTKSGTPRQKDWRAYYYTGEDGKRERFISATTLLDAICPKGGLPDWSEKRGIEGTLEAVRRGALDTDATDLQAIATVRSLRLGADRAKDDAADRGIDVHSCLEEYMTTGTPPSTKDKPVQTHGYYQALSRWLLKTNLEPVLVEELVCSPDDRYAGRMDLLARTDGFLGAWDAKTQENAGIYSTAHLQLRLYIRGHIACGGDPPDFARIVVFAANGEFREMELMVDDDALTRALAYYQAIHPVDLACEAMNRAEKKARAAA